MSKLEICGDYAKGDMGNFEADRAIVGIQIDLLVI
jgi:hypothetical protein